MFMKNNAGSADYTGGANTTVRFKNDAGGIGITDSNGVQTPPGSFLQSVTASGSANTAGIIFSIKPTVATFTPTPMMHMMQMAGGIV
jgi:hypothetical protein